MADEAPVVDVNAAPAADPGQSAPAADVSGDSSPAPVVTPVTGDIPADAPAEGAPWYQGAPDDWREQIAGDNEGHLNQLKRMTEPGQVFKSFFDGQDTIRSRTENAGLPADPSPEQLTAYREENGIPAAAGDYAQSLNEGLILSEAEAENLGPVFAVMHENNFSTDVAAELVDTYLGVQELEAQRRVDQDNLDATEATRAMQGHWGGDFEQNKNIMVAMLQTHLPGESFDAFMGARMADGKAIFNDPGVMSAFAEIARTLNPAATLVPSGENPIASLDSTIAALEAKMQEPGWHMSDGPKKYMEAMSAKEALTARQQ